MESGKKGPPEGGWPSEVDFDSPTNRGSRGAEQDDAPQWLRDGETHLAGHRDLQGQAARSLGIRLPKENRPEDHRSGPEARAPRPKPANRPEPSRVSRRGFLGKALKWGAITAGISAVTVPPIAYLAAKLKGKGLLEEALKVAKTKHAIAIKVRDPDLPSDTVGFIYGARAQTSEELWGHDRAIPVEPEDLGKGGHLHWWYKGLMELEDKGHEGGSSDKWGIDIKGTIRALLHFGTSGSGSNLADQACKSLRAGDKEYEKMGRLKKMLVDKSCGIALGTTREPREIGAHYATFGFLAPGAPGVETFSRLYWRFENGTRDEKMTIGHQLVLASMLRYTWTGKNGGLDERWENINHRARIAAIRLLHDVDNVTDLFRELKFEDYDQAVTDRALYELGARENRELKEILLTEEFKESLKQFDPPSQRKLIARQWLAYKKLEEQIDAARPYAQDQIKDMPGGMGISPTPGYDFPIYLAAQEAKALFGDDWRAQVNSITITVDPNAQFTAHTEARKVLDTVNETARACVLAINHDGEIVATFSGGKTGFDGINRLDSSRSPGSIGKIILALRVAQLAGAVRDNPAYEQFRHNLASSNSSVIQYAREMGVGDATVEALMECYGTLHPDRGNDALWGAAMGGSFDTTPEKMLQLLMDPQMEGSPVGRARIVYEYEMKDGRRIPGDFTKSDLATRHAVDRENARRNHCAQLADPRSRENFHHLMEAPVKEPYGTFKVAKDVADMGKTGTVGEIQTGKTNMALALGTAQVRSRVREELFGVISIIGADKRHNENGEMIAINTAATGRTLGGDIAGPITAAVLRTIKERVQSGKIE